MSFASTSMRPFARSGGGSDWRGLSSARAGAVGPAVYRSPLLGTPAPFKMIGVSRDSAGNPLATCRCALFLTSGDVFQQAVTSDGSGNFRFDVSVPGPYYVVFYKAGAPDVGGTTLNTLIAV